MRCTGLIAVAGLWLTSVSFCPLNIAEETFAVSEQARNAVVVDRSDVGSVATSEGIEYFEKHVRPLLAEHCYECHSTRAEKLAAGLRVDSRTGLLQGGDSGPGLVSGDVDGSLIVEAVRYESYEMPPKGKLSDDQIRLIERWVEMGAPWPKEDAPAGTATAVASGGSEPDKFDVQARRDSHWVWQPIRSPNPPAVAEKDWPQDPLDHFVLARLEAAGLRPAVDAEAEAWMRRVYFDLIGLPPTIEQADRFLRDSSDDADERLVDELLKSPHFGERWARHWLDLVRYAESRGHEFDNDTPNAFQYRDYVIRMFNEDVPYDQIVREHIAGDLIESPRRNPTSGFNESILGTGFWFLGEWAHSPVDIRKDEADRFDNMIDVMSKTFLGVTVACARCHDHKFDAIPTSDYYALSGFLQSSDFREVRFESLEQNREIAAQLAAVDARYRELIMLSIDQANNDQTKEAQAKEAQTKDLPSLPQDVASKVVVDYGSIATEDFLQDGFLFGPHPIQRGTPLVCTVDGKAQLEFARETAARSDEFWHGLESVTQREVQSRSALANIEQSGRTLRTPTFALEHGDVWIRVKGRGHVFACVDSHRLVAGPLHGETVRPIADGETWVQMNLSRYVGHRIALELTPAADATLAASCVVVGASAADREAIDSRIAEGAAAVDEFTAAVKTPHGDQLDEILATWTDERRELGTRVQRSSHLAIAMQDVSGEDDHILIRGNSSKPGVRQPRQFLTAIRSAQPMQIEHGSGRLELAEEINSPDNPLTTRVIVNRVWHYLMGRGIVPTTDDFGVLGQSPSHPELLDYLATQFAADGQSIKRLIRRIVLSRTYRMSCLVDPQAASVDPKNLLWHHRPIRRLEGEAIRDALLVQSGRLDPTMFGPSVPIHLTPFMEGRGRPGQNGPLDGANRRSIYTEVRRNFLSPLMTTFDSPTPFSTMGRRNVSNVPAQSLILMNDPFVVEQAKAWGERLVTEVPDPDDRIGRMVRAAFARTCTDAEHEAMLAYVQSQANQRGVNVNDPTLWSDLTHALINMKEFIFIP